MTRIAGFLRIDTCPKELAHEHHKKTNHYWVNIDGTEYYFKPTNFYYNELIAYHTAKFLGIDACFCDLAILNGEKGIISKSLRKENTKLISGRQIIKEYIYKSLNNLLYTKKMIKNSGIFDWIFNKNYRNRNDMCMEYINNLEIIWQVLEERYKNDQRFNIESIMHQFILMYIFTILVYDGDRYACNWLIEETNLKIKLAPLFDNEDAFNYTNEKIKQEHILKYAVNIETSDYNQLASLRTFLEISSSNYYDLFLELFEKISNNFDIIIKNVENQIGIEIPINKKERIISNFNTNMEQINKVLSEFKFNKNTPTK